MSYTFEKHHVEHFEVEKVRLNFIPYKSFQAVRKDKPNCEFCDKPFAMDDMIHMAIVKNMVNHAICKSCAEHALENGAQEV